MENDFEVCYTFYDVNIYNRTISKSEKWINTYNGNLFHSPEEVSKDVAIQMEDLENQYFAGTYAQDYEDILDDMKQPGVSGIVYTDDDNAVRGYLYGFQMSLEDQVGVHSDYDEEDLEETFGDAKRAFQSFTRAGFTEEELEDEGHLEAFRIGAGALIEVGAQLQNFLSSISRVVRHDSLLEEKFKKDQEIFSNQFHTIYGVSP